MDSTILALPGGVPAALAPYARLWAWCAVASTRAPLACVPMTIAAGYRVRVRGRVRVRVEGRRQMDADKSHMSGPP